MTHNLLYKLPPLILRRVPGFEIRYKDESWFMKMLGWLAFFNPDFMTRYTTTWGWCVYFPSRAAVEAEPEKYGKVLAHEYVHLLDKQKYGFRYILSYVSPQIWALGALGALGAFYSSWFLLFLLFLLFLAPWPMSLVINRWRYGRVHPDTLAWLVDVFCGWQYYKICWTRKAAEKVVDGILLDSEYITFKPCCYKNIQRRENPAFGDVFGILDA